MKTKYQLLNIHMFERKALETYLHEMAKQGWRIDKLRYFYMRFRKCEPCTLYYQVGFDDSTGIFYLTYDEGKDSNLTAFMESFGYTYISSVGIMRLFESETNDSFFSEPEIDEQAFRSATFRDELSKSIMPFVFTLLMTLLQIRQRADYLWYLSSNMDLAFLGIFITLTLYYLLRMIPYLRYCINHQERTNFKRFRRIRAFNAILPGLLLFTYLLFLLPSSLYIPIVLVVITVFIMRGLLYYIQNHVQSKKLWRTIVMIGYVITFVLIVQNTTDINIEFPKSVPVPIITAEDFGMSIGKENNYYDHSLILSQLDYFDDSIMYQYYHVEDTILAGYCRYRILDNYDLLDQKPQKQNGVQYYKMNTEDKDVYTYLLVKGNDFLIINNHLETYLALFQERV